MTLSWTFKSQFINRRTCSIKQLLAQKRGDKQHHYNTYCIQIATTMLILQQWRTYQNTIEHVYFSKQNKTKLCYAMKIVFELLKIRYTGHYTLQEHRIKYLDLPSIQIYFKKTSIFCFITWKKLILIFFFWMEEVFEILQGKAGNMQNFWSMCFCRRCRLFAST